jgi:hypothetical protein
MLVSQFIFAVHKLLLTVFHTPMRCYKLESEPERISSSTTTAPPKSHVKLIAVIAIVAVAVIVGAFLVSAFLSSPQGQNAWLFKGAYAEYEGSTTVSFVTIDFTIRQEVLDFNSTHVKMSTYFNMGSSYGESVENETTAWVPLSQMGFMNAFEEGNLTTSYESTVDIAGFGTRTCMVYEYTISDERLTMTVYVDKAIDWPLKMTVSMTGGGPITLSLDINLVETNIPALK